MNFRRFYVPGSTIFITQVVAGRKPLLTEPANLTLLRETMHEVKRLHPFRILAYVFLPNHLHLLIVPNGSSNFSQIMHSLKRNFTVAYKQKHGIGKQTPVRFWQQRFWDHVIRDETDFELHMHYIHYNAVKHGLVTRPEDWLHSSFGYWQTKGYYDTEWGLVEPEALTAMEIPVGE